MSGPPAVGYSPAVPTPPRYRSAPSPAVRPPRTLVTVGLGLAAVQMLVTQLNPAAPLRQGRALPLAVEAAGRPAFTAPLVRLAAGRNLGLHFRDPVPTPQTDRVISDVYYSLGYDLFPARALIGEDRRPINDGPTLRAADHVPPDRWSAAHGVADVVTFPVDAAGLHQPTVRRVDGSP